MKDPRMGKLAENLVRYSCHLEPGEKVLFETFDCPDFVLEALICAAYQAGAQPYFQAHRTKVERQWLREPRTDRAADGLGRRTHAADGCVYLPERQR